MIGYGEMVTKFKKILDKPADFNILAQLPQWATWFLGYRKRPRKQVPPLAREIFHFLMTFAALIVNLAIAQYSALTTSHWNVHTLIPSFGATCVLLFGVPHAPYSQPRNVIFGHFISAIIGVGIAKLFLLIDDHDKYMWLSGSLSVSMAIFFMECTDTIHPPAGATALITSLNKDFRSIGWNYLPLLLLHTVVFLGVALLGHNLYTNYPVYWIANTPGSDPVTDVVVSKNSLKLPDGLDLDKKEYELLMKIQERI